MTTLESLALDAFCPPSPPPDATVLTPLSRLTALHLNCNTDICLLARSNAGLQDLTLVNACQLTAEGVSLIQKATKLTRLDFEYGRGQGGNQGHGVGPMRFVGILSGMTGLQALSLTLNVDWGISCFAAIGRLTALTRLEWYEGHLTYLDVVACTRLKKLRVLRLFPHPAGPPGRISLAAFSALATLPELSRMTMSTKTGITAKQVTDEVKTMIDARRHSMGWPPLDLCLATSYPDRYPGH
jgi:hypothetical protein